MKLRAKPQEIRRRRLQLLWDQKTLAAKAGLSESAISFIENGDRSARPPTIAAIAEALGCDPFDIAEIVEPEPSEATA